MTRLGVWILAWFPPLFLAGCGSGTDETSTVGSSETVAVESGLAAISRDGIEAHLLYLADDERMGRMTGTAAYDEAAAYVAGHFEAIGLEPAGDDGWYQQVPMLARRIDVDSAAVVYHQDGGDNRLRWKEDFVMDGDGARPETEIRSEVVFAGFGIHAPDLGYSDYEGVDVDGKVLAIFGGAPSNFPHNERAYYSSGLTKAQEAVARGAVGIISLRSRVDQKRYTWKRLSENAGIRPGMSWVNLTGRVANYFPELEGRAILNEPAAEDLFRTAPISYEQALDAADAGTPLSTPLGYEITLAQRTEHETIESPNVVGVLRGSDPELAGEYVVYSAHLDHVGTGVPVNGDSIYNGMYDNAMGVALLIEAARAFAAMPERPRRSILFVAVTGEERGLVGSDYYAHYPTVPSDAMIANVNLDMPLLLYPLADVIAFGSEHSSLEGLIASVVATEQFQLAPDPVPEEVLFIRSDQYSFVKQGVPSVFLVPGFTSTDPNVDGAAAFRAHLQTHYHQPSDDLSRPIDWDSALRFARVNVRIGHAVAQQDGAPTWNAGDFFGEKFGK
ncbi:MAG: M28 family metallopeptidase [Gammaproteobacteria bacterium]|nr:M28 family metallopeptidase [Gammaproteobacteria bacterium]